MRWIIMLTLALVLSTSAAFAAASSYEDVQPDHWAYNALDYLTEQGVLEGYPDGYFKGDRTLTRYEFAQAIARLLDTINTNGADEQVNIMPWGFRWPVCCCCLGGCSRWGLSARYSKRWPATATA